MLLTLILCVLAPLASTQGNELVAFSVELSETLVIDEDSPIIFDTTLANFGARYANASGSVECLHDDLYALHWSIEENNNHYQGIHNGKAKLMRETEEVKYGPGTSVITYHGAVTSGVSQMSSVARCVSGTAFTITAERFSPDDIGTEYVAQSTALSGFRIKDGSGFTAELSSDTELAPGTRIPFDTVNADANGLYDPIGHTMTCPDDGVYHFTWTIQANFTARAAAALMFEEDEHLFGPATYKSPPFFPSHNSGTSSASAVLPCQPGMNVYVESRETPELQPTTVFNSVFTSFSGYRIGDANTTAFTAILRSNQSAVRGDTIAYDDAIVNIGEHFDESISQFICPDNMVYFFIWSVHNDLTAIFTHLEMAGNVVKEGPTTSYVYVLGDEGSSGTSSMSTVLRCVEGASVSVVFSRQMFPGFGEAIADFNTFSGFQIPGQD